VAAACQPGPEAAEIYDPMFREFVGLDRRNRKTFARLNRVRPPARPVRPG